jgi:hypothetical protein
MAALMELRKIFPQESVAGARLTAAAASWSTNQTGEVFEKYVKVRSFQFNHTRNIASHLSFIACLGPRRI